MIAQVRRRAAVRPERANLPEARPAALWTADRGNRGLSPTALG